MLDYFAKEKSDFLKKRDKSKKGQIDRDIVKIVNKINSKKDYYTTSSCTCRIVLLEMKSRKKNECNWLLNKNGKVTLKEIINSLNNKLKNNKKYQIWFKQQPIILHVACRNIEAAKRLLDASRKVFKRSGVISITERKAVLEIIGSEILETIIADKNFAADEKYLKNLIKYANGNFEENKRKSERFFKIIEKI